MPIPEPCLCGDPYCPSCFPGRQRRRPEPTEPEDADQFGRYDEEELTDE